MKHGILLAILLLLGSACTVGGVRQIPPEPTLYLLTAVGDPARVTFASDRVLRVSPPRAEPGFDGDGIVYTETPLALYYFSESRWADAPARMLTPLLVETLERSGAFRAVLTSPGGGSADYQLDIKLLRLQHEFFEQPSRVRVGMRAGLIDTATNRVLASRSFETTEASPSEDAFGGVQAANTAVARLLAEIADFVVDSL